MWDEKEIEDGQTDMTKLISCFSSFRVRSWKTRDIQTCKEFHIHYLCTLFVWFQQTAGHTPIS